MKIRKNTTISPAILQQAEELMALRSFDDFSEFVSALIREERERRQGPIHLPEPAALPGRANYTPPNAASLALNETSPASTPAPKTRHQTNFGHVTEAAKRILKKATSSPHPHPHQRPSPGPKP
jgi:hypothetical protein